MSRYRSSVLSDCRVFIGDLGNNGKSYEIADTFSYYGPLRNVWVARNPPDFAFVEFEDPRDARDAVRDLDGKFICGRRVTVELSNRRDRNSYRPRSRYIRDQRCYECGRTGHFARECEFNRRRLSRSRSRSPHRRTRSRSRNRETNISSGQGLVQQGTRDNTSDRSVRYSKSQSRSASPSRPRSPSTRRHTRSRSKSRSFSQSSSPNFMPRDSSAYDTERSQRDDRSRSRSAFRSRSRSPSTRRHTRSKSKSRSASRASSRDDKSRSRSASRSLSPLQLNGRTPSKSD